VPPRSRRSASQRRAARSANPAARRARSAGDRRSSRRARSVALTVRRGDGGRAKGGRRSGVERARFPVRANGSAARAKPFALLQQPARRRRGQTRRSRVFANSAAHRPSPPTAPDHHAQRSCPRTSAVAGRATLPLRCRERWRNGIAAGGHPHFFGDPVTSLHAPRTAIRLHLMRDPANHPFARFPAAAPLAFSRAEASPDRASGGRESRLRCACGKASALG
jgi:hypothetical protein